MPYYYQTDYILTIAVIMPTYRLKLENRTFHHIKSIEAISIFLASYGLFRKSIIF